MTSLNRLLCGVLAAVLLVIGAWFGVRHYGAEQYQAGHAAAVAERAQADAVIVLTRADENKAKSAQQTLDNIDITKEKDHEIANLRQRLAATGRLRVGPAVCPDRPAAANTESSAGSNSADSSAGLVSTAADRDLKQLIEDVEQDLATGRSCQAFLKKNGLVP